MRATVGSMTIPEIRLEPQITINIPEQKATVVNVDVPAPVVNVAAPTVNVAAPEVTVEAPTVNVAAPEVKAGFVQDIRIIEMPARATTQVVVRDPQGRVVGLETATD